jgi:hypothetical protein
VQIGDPRKHGMDSFSPAATSGEVGGGTARAERPLERERPAVDGVGALPGRVSPQGRAGQQGGRAARLRRAGGAAGGGGVAGPAPPASRDVWRGDRRMDRRGLPDGVAEQPWSPCPDQVTEHGRQRPLPPRRPRPLRGGQALGRSDHDRPPRGGVPEDGGGGLRHQHHPSRVADLNQACLHAVRQRRTRLNPAADVLLPEARPPMARKSCTIEQLERLLVDAIPQDARPAMWLTGLMCGLRPGGLTGLRWPFRRHRRRRAERRRGRARPRGARPLRRPGQAQDGAPGPDRPAPVGGGRPAAPPGDMRLLGLYDPDGLVFCTRNGTAQSLSNLRRAFQQLCGRAGLVDEEWTTYELRHSFVSLVADQLDDLADGGGPGRSCRHPHHPGPPARRPPVVPARHRGVGRHLGDGAAFESPARSGTRAPSSTARTLRRGGLSSGCCPLPWAAL